MKKIWLVLIAVIVVPSFVFVPRINAKDAGISPNDGWPTKEEIKKIAEDKTIETIRVPKGTFEPEPAEPKFSISIGAGNGYKLGDWEQGRRYTFDNSLPLLIKFGYSPCKYVEFQGEYLNTNFYAKRSWGEQYLRFNNYGLNLKLKAPIDIKNVAFSPYFIVGTGKSRLTYDGAVTGMGSYKYSGSGKYTKIGGGAEINIYKNIMLFSELNYWKMGLINFDAGNGIIVENRMYFSTVTGGIGLRF